MIIYDSVGLVVDRVVGVEFCIGVDVEVNISKVELKMWIHCCKIHLNEIMELYQIFWALALMVKVESGNVGWIGLEFGGGISSRYVRSVGKYVKGGVNVTIDDNVGWGVNRGVVDWFCSGVDSM